MRSTRWQKTLLKVWQMRLDMPNPQAELEYMHTLALLWLSLNVCNWPHPCSSAHAVCLGNQSTLEPDLQAKRAGAGENTQSAKPGAGITGAAGGLQAQRPSSGSVPQPTTVCPQWVLLTHRPCWYKSVNLWSQKGFSKTANAWLCFSFGTFPVVKQPPFAMPSTWPLLLVPPRQGY